MKRGDRYQKRLKFCVQTKATKVTIHCPVPGWKAFATSGFSTHGTVISASFTAYGCSPDGTLNSASAVSPDFVRILHLKSVFCGEMHPGGFL